MDASYYKQWLADYGDPMQTPKFALLNLKTVKKPTVPALIVTKLMRLMVWVSWGAWFYAVLSEEPGSGTPMWVWGLIATTFALFVAHLLLVKQDAGTPEERLRNQELYARIYDKVKSNTMASHLMYLTAVEANRDIYTTSLEEALEAVAHESRERTTIASRDCSQGHAMLCVHHLPQHITQWLGRS